MKTVGDTFYIFYMSYRYFKIKKNAQNPTFFDRQIKQKPLFLYPTEEPCTISKRFNETVVAFYKCYMSYHY